MTVSRNAFISWIKAFASAITENKELLTQLDSAIGDADHGINMERGFQSVVAKLPAFQNQDIGAISKNVGMVLTKEDGGEILMIDPTFNFAAVKRDEGRDMVIISKFEVKEKQTQEDL